jgi:hypothetical protein
MTGAAMPNKSKKVLCVLGYARPGSGMGRRGQITELL